MAQLGGAGTDFALQRGGKFIFQARGCARPSDYPVFHMLTAGGCCVCWAKSCLG